MSQFYTSSIYAQNLADPDWSGTGSLFLRLYQSWAYNDGVKHIMISKNANPHVATQFFVFEKNENHNVYIGFYDAAEYRVIADGSDCFTPSTWRNHIYTWDVAGEIEEYYVDNTLCGSHSGAFVIPAGLSRVTFGFLESGAGPDGPANAFYAEHGRWDRILTASERAILEVTGCPLHVPDGLVEYHPLLGPIDTGADYAGGMQLTQVGGAAIAPHPRTIYPRQGYFAAQIPGTGVAPLTLQPPVISSTITLFAPELTEIVTPRLEPPLIANPVTVFAPTLLALGDLTIEPPLLTSTITLYAPGVVESDASIQIDEREIEPHNYRVRIVDFVGGDDLRIQRLYTELPEGITIATAYLTIKRQATSSDSLAIIQKTITASASGSGHISDASTTGTTITLYFDLSSTDTALLTPLIPYNYDVQIVSSGAAIYTCEKGVIVMHQGVTAAAS